MGREKEEKEEKKKEKERKRKKKEDFPEFFVDQIYKFMLS